MLANLLAMALYATDVVSSPPVIFALIIVGFVLGALAGMRWDHEDDFPEAPPPRMG